MCKFEKSYFTLMPLNNLDRISISGVHFNANCLLFYREKCGENGAEHCEGGGGVIRGKTGKFDLIIVPFCDFTVL